MKTSQKVHFTISILFVCVATLSMSCGEETVSGGPNSSIMDMAPEIKNKPALEFLPVTLMICQVKLVCFVATMITKPSGLKTLTCWQVLTSTFLFQNPITIAKPM